MVTHFQTRTWWTRWTSSLLRLRKFALGSLLFQPERVWFVPGICKHLAPVSQCVVPVRSLATEAAPRAEPSGWRPTGGYWRLLPDQRDSWINDLKRAGKCCGLLTRSLVEAWRTVGQTSERCLQSLEAWHPATPHQVKTRCWLGSHFQVWH